MNPTRRYVSHPKTEAASKWLSKVGWFSLVAGAASTIAGQPGSDAPWHSPRFSVPAHRLAIGGHSRFNGSRLLQRQSGYRLPGQRPRPDLVRPLDGADGCPGAPILPGTYTAASPYTDSGTTVGRNSTIENYAGDYYYTWVGGPDVVYSFTLTATGPNPRIEVSTTSATYNPAVYILNGMLGKRCPAGVNNPVYAIMSSDHFIPSTETFESDAVRSLPHNMPLHLVVDSSQGFSQFGSGPYTLRMQDVTISESISVPANDAPLDMDGDGKTDLVLVRNTGGGAGGQLTWYTRTSGDQFLTPQQWGVEGDKPVSADFDSDGRDDIAVWRPGQQGRFYIIHSSTQTLNVIDFGQTGDDPTVVSDYTGDGIDDLAVYRPGTAPGQQSFWYYRPVNASPDAFVRIPFGEHGDRPVPGNYNGYYGSELAVQRPEGSHGRFFVREEWESVWSKVFGQADDILVPADYNGDGITDLGVVRPGPDGYWSWHWLPRVWEDTPLSSLWGVAATDIIAPGDYDGDGRAEFAVWRPGSPGVFFQKSALDGWISSRQWGQSGDEPAAQSKKH